MSDFSPAGLLDEAGHRWMFFDRLGEPTGPYGPWVRARAGPGGAAAAVREFRPVDARRWSMASTLEPPAAGGASTRFAPAAEVIELLPEPARWRAWALTEPEGWEIRMTARMPGSGPLLEAMGPGAFLGALEGVGGPHTSAIAEFQRPGEPPRCWVWDAEQAGLTLPYREGDFLMVSYLPVGAGEIEHAIVSSLAELHATVQKHRARGDRRRAAR